MIFDLEIQPNVLQLTNIAEGTKIPNSAIPIYYYNVNNYNVVPSDLIEIDETYTNTGYTNLPITPIPDGSKFITFSDSFMLTHVVKYSKATGARTPLFWKHSIDITNVVQTSAILNSLISSIRVSDINGNVLSPDMFATEISGSTIFVYMNKISELMFISYNTQASVINEMAKLTPVFTQEVFAYYTNSTGLQTYQYYALQMTDSSGIRFSVTTGYSGSLYLLYKQDIGLIRPPVGNLSDPWYLNIANSSIIKNDLLYTIPEFYLQRASQPTLGVQNFEKQVAKILNGNFVKLQTEVDPTYINKITIYLKNNLTGTYDYVYTTNKTLYNTIYDSSNIQYRPVLDYNYSGILQLPITVDQTYSAYVDYTYLNNDYVFQSLDINSLNMNISNLVAVYIAPSGSAQQVSVYFAYIGYHDPTSYSDKYMKFGAGFDTVEDYQGFIDDKNCLHLCYVSMSTNSLFDMISLSDVRNSSQNPIDHTNVVTEDQDILIGDILNNNITIPYASTVIINVDGNSLSPADDTNKTIKDQQYTDFILETSGKNLEVTTKALINIIEPPQTTTTTTTTPPHQAIDWWNIVDINIWGADGSGTPDSKYGELGYYPTDGYTNAIDLASMTQPNQGVDIMGDASRADVNGNVFVSSAFWGRNNPPIEQYTQDGSYITPDTSSWSDTLAWRPTKIRATFTGTDTVHIIVQDYSGFTIAEASGMTSGQELDIVYTDNTHWSYLTSVTLDSPGTGYSINNFNGFTLTALEMYGDDPSKYYLVGDYTPPIPQL